MKKKLSLKTKFTGSDFLSAGYFRKDRNNYVRKEENGRWHSKMIKGFFYLHYDFYAVIGQTIEHRVRNNPYLLKREILRIKKVI